MQTPGDIESVLNQDDDSMKMAWIQATGEDWIRDEAEGLTKLTKKLAQKAKRLRPKLTPLTPLYAHMNLSFE